MLYKKKFLQENYNDFCNDRLRQYFHLNEEKQMKRFTFRIPCS